MTNPNSPVKAAGNTEDNGVCAEDALEELRLNRSHTIPPGQRGIWVATKLQRLSEEHLSATDETTTAALGALSRRVLPRPRLRQIRGVVGTAAGILVVGGLAGFLLAAPPKDAPNPATTASLSTLSPAATQAVAPSLPPTAEPAHQPVDSSAQAPAPAAKGTARNPQARPATTPKQSLKSAPAATQKASDPDEPIFKVR